MANSTILMHSVTGALRAQKLLEQKGFRSNIRKISNHSKLGGCGYGLEVQGDAGAILYFLQSANIKTIGLL